MRTRWQSLLVTFALGGLLWAAVWSYAVASQPAPNMPIGDPNTRAIYLLLDGQKRLIPDTATLEALGFSLNDVQWDTGDLLAKTTSGPNLLPFSVGDLIRDEETGTIYLLEGGKRTIPDQETLRACGWSESSTRPLSSTLASAIPLGKPFPMLRPGDLIRRRGDVCLYLLAGGRHWLPDDSLLEVCNWSERGVREVEPLVLASIPEGDVVPSLYFGCLVQSTDTGEQGVYILDRGKHLIPDKATFQAYGWQESRIWRVPPALLETIPEGAPLASAKKGENPFAYQHWGQCTWYVAERRLAPSYRDAKDWYADAQTNGFATGQRPMPGAIIVYGVERGIYGHVAYIETAYADGAFALVDSNICGWECVRTRITDLSKEIGVLGFVYWKYE
mgnify:CR=1 FL=1